MYPQQLIGKKALRTRGIKYPSGAVDRSMMQHPVIILAATESHIVVEYDDSLLKGSRSILSYEWIDNNWTSYDDLIALTDPKHVALMQSLNEGAENP
jgi:hypothetical protein